MLRNSWEGSASVQSDAVRRAAAKLRESRAFKWCCVLVALGLLHAAGKAGGLW